MARPNLRNHRKFKRLVVTLGIPETHVRGMLEYIWESAYENGDEFIGDALDVEIAGQWGGEPGKFCKALLEAGGTGESGFIDANEDGKYFVHDLWDHAPEYVMKRKKREIERQKSGDEIRKCLPNGGQRRPKSAEWRTESENQRTLADCGEPPAPAPAPAPAHAQKTYTSDFEDFWIIYPRHTDKSRAFKSWNARLKEKAEPSAIIQAAKNYSADCQEKRTAETYIKHPATFLGPDWIEWLDRKPRELTEEEKDPYYVKPVY